MILLLALSLCGCSVKNSTPQKHSSRFFAMDTFMEITVYSEHDPAAVFEACQNRVSELDSLLSVHNPSGDLGRLNSSRGTIVSVSPETLTVLRAASEICAVSDGAFNIATGSLTELWGFETDSPRVPDQEAVRDLLPLPGPECLAFHENGVSLEKPVSLNLGAIAKGYCSDDLCRILKENGVTSALLSLGGNISAVGSKPDGSLWKIAVQDPSDPSGYVGIVSVRDKSVVTSGSYQRFFTENGKNYHHILDPETGFPAESGLLSVTVISDSGTYADALSTCFFVLGISDSLALLDRLPDQIRPDGIIFVLNDHSIQIAGNPDFVPAEGISSVQLP